MRRVPCLGVVLAVAALLFAITPAASSAKTHTYPVQLKIEVDRAEHKVKGQIITEAPSQFCEESAVRLMEVEPGKDRKVASFKPFWLGKFGFTISPRLRGSKVYVEVLRYHLPQRPVICLAARSHAVAAP
jgi:hypothetical protein